MKSTLLSIFALILLLSCSKSVTEPAGPVLNPDELRQGVSISYNDLDTLVITGLINLNHDQQSIESIALGDIAEDGTFILQQTTIPAYSGQPGNYEIAFELTRQLDGSEMDLHFALQFRTQNGVSTRVEFNEPVHLHPYPSIQVYFENNAIPNAPGTVFDIQKDQEVLYFSASPQGTINDARIYKFDRIQGSIVELLDNVYTWNWDIYKDPQSSEVELWLNNSAGLSIDRFSTINPGNSLGSFSISTTEYQTVTAIDVQDNFFYAVLAHHADQRFALCKIDFTGQILETEPFPAQVQHIEVQEDKVLAINWDQHHSSFYLVDRRNGSIISEALAPSIGARGFDIQDGLLYYSDVFRNHIASIDLGEFD